MIMAVVIMVNDDDYHSFIIIIIIVGELEVERCDIRETPRSSPCRVTIMHGNSKWLSRSCHDLFFTDLINLAPECSYRVVFSHHCDLCSFPPITFIRLSSGSISRILTHPNVNFEERTNKRNCWCTFQNSQIHLEAGTLDQRFFFILNSFLIDQTRESKIDLVFVFHDFAVL